MISQISIVGVPVRDQQQAIDFLVDVLGFEVRTDQPMGDPTHPQVRWVELVPKGAESRPALVPYTWLDAEQAAGSYSRIALETGDVDKLYADLTARGVRFDGPPFDDPAGGRFVLLRDPFDSQFIIAQTRG
jgi:catechol 2,3-dioxygenase-like lactoylglutathione lyase family enzyme